MTSWRTRRARSAPSAARSANSPRRCAPRARRRLVTLTQAMTSNTSTAANTASSAGRISRATSAWSEVTMSPAWSDAHGTRGMSARGVRAMAERSARAACEIDAGANAPDQTEVMSPFARLRRERRLVLERSPDVGVRRRNVLERRRHDADDEIRIVVERDASTDDGGIAAESAVPERVAQDHDSRSAVAIVGCREVAAANGSNAERTEVVRADGLSAQPFGFGAALRAPAPTA